MNFVKTLLKRLRGEFPTDALIKRGMSIGKNFHRMNEVWIDPGHCWLISFGDNVTLAPRVTVLAHDASPQAFQHVTKIGCVSIGDNVFIGACSVILPVVKIGSNVIVGAGSVVTKDLPDNTVCAGNPYCPIKDTSDYIAKVKAISQEYGHDYLYPAIDKHRMDEMKAYLGGKTRFANLVRK